MLDRVLLRVGLPEPTGDWLADLRTIAESHSLTLLENSWAIAPLFSHPDPGPGANRRHIGQKPGCPPASCSPVVQTKVVPHSEHLIS